MILIDNVISKLYCESCISSSGPLTYPQLASYFFLFFDIGEILFIPICQQIMLFKRLQKLALSKLRVISAIHLSRWIFFLIKKFLDI